MEYLGQSIYKTIEDLKTGETNFILKIQKSQIDLYNVFYGRAGGATYDIPYTVINSTFVLSDFSTPKYEAIEFNDAYFAEQQYFFLDYMVIEQGQTDQKRYMTVYRCDYFYDKLKCQFIGSCLQPSHVVKVKVDIQTRTFFVIDYSIPNQNIMIYKLDETEFSSSKVFSPIRTISKDDWGLKEEQLILQAQDQYIVIEPSTRGIFSVFFENVRDQSGSIAIFNANLTSQVTRYLKIPEAFNEIYSPTGYSQNENFVSYYYSESPGNITFVFSWPSIEFQINHNYDTKFSQKDTYQNYRLQLRGIKKIDIEQILRGEIRYNLKITQKVKDKYTIATSSKVDLTTKYNGVILNTCLDCDEQMGNTTYYYDTREITQIECNDAVNATLNQYMRLKYRLSDLNSTQNFLKGIKDWKIFEINPSYFLVLHGQLSILKLDDHSTIVAFVGVVNDKEQYIDMENCLKILDLQYLNPNTEANLLCIASETSQNVESFKFIIKDEWIIGPPPPPPPPPSRKLSTPNNTIDYFPLYPETPVFQTSYKRLSYTNSIMKKALETAIHYEFDHGMLIILDYLDMQNDQQKYYLNIYNYNEIEDFFVELELKYSTLSQSEYVYLIPTSFVIFPVSIDDNIYQFKLITTLEQDSYFFIQFCYFTKRLTEDKDLILRNPCQTKRLNLPTKNVIHRYLKYIEESVFLYLIDETLLFEYSISDEGVIEQLNTYKHVSICEGDSQKRVYKYDNFLMFQCLGSNENNAIDQIILFLRNKKNVDENGFINPVQFETFSDIQYPRASVMSIFNTGEQNMMLISHPQFFISQYDLHSKSYVNFTVNDKVSKVTNLKLRLSNIFSSSEFSISVRGNPIWSYLKFVELWSKEYALQVVIMIYILSILIIYRVMLGKIRILEKHRLKSADNREDEMKQYLEKRNQDLFQTPQLLA